MVWEDLNKWRTRDENCDITEEDNLICLPCLKLKQLKVSDDERRKKMCLFSSSRCGTNETRYYTCPFCAELKIEISYRRHQCIISTSARKLLNELTVDQTENISNNFLRVFTESVCTVTKMQDLRRDLRTFTPPWGVLGLGYSLRNCSINEDNYLTHHALGTTWYGEDCLMLPPQETRTTGPRGRQTSRPSPWTPRPSRRQTPHTNYSTYTPTD